MKAMRPLALMVLASISSASVNADPMLERQALLEKERQSYLDQRAQQYSDAVSGWHFYVDPKEQEQAQEADDPATPAQSAEQPVEKVKIDVKWLRENLPHMLDDAMNNPGDMQKLKLYWLAQKMAVDMATKFQDGTRRMYLMNSELSENNRRPETQFQLETHNKQVIEGKKKAVQTVFDRAGLWFFYSSTCQYCIKEGPILNYLERLFNVNVLAVSMDGQPLPGSDFKDVVVDQGGVMSMKLAVERTPTMFLVTNDGKTIHKLSEGLLTLDELVDTILYVAQGAGVITEAELQESRDVRQYLMTDAETLSTPTAKPSLIEINKSDLESGPDALIKEFESRLNFPSHDTAPVNPAGGQTQ